MARQELARSLRACVALAAMAVLIVPASADAASYAKRTLTQGSQGSDVKKLQKYLVNAGFRTATTGYYGSQTAGAQRDFEDQEGRRVDGRATRADQRAVRRAAKAGASASEDATGGQSHEEPAPNTTARAVASAGGRTAIAPESAPPEVKIGRGPSRERV